jgi:hypothetical protein
VSSVPASASPYSLYLVGLIDTCTFSFVFARSEHRTEQVTVWAVRIILYIYKI